MTETNDEGPPTPGQAFAVLGNETRVNILQELAASGEPLSFTELRNRVGLRQGAQFNYHLTKLVGHFVEKTEAGYGLRQPGRRVVQAVLAGAVDEGPELAPTRVDYDCHFCGSSIEVGYIDGEFVLHCAECLGDPSNAAASDQGAEHSGSEHNGSEHYGNLARIPFPPAGIHDRTPAEALRAAATWVHLNSIALSSDVCPGCAASVDLSVAVCEDHDRGTAGRDCARCGHYHAVRPEFSCANCHVTYQQPVVMALLSAPEVLTFVGSHGLNVTSRGLDWGWDYEEEMLSTDPLEARFTFTIDGDDLIVTVDGGLNVLDATV